MDTPLADQRPSAAPVPVLLTAPAPFPSIGQAVALTCLFLVLQITIGLFAGILNHGKPPTTLLITAINVACFCAVFGAAALMSDLNIDHALAFRAVPIRLFVPMTLTIVGLFATLLVVDSLVVWLLPPPRFMNEIFKDLVGGGNDRWTSLILLTVVAPITEELLFRGLFLGGFLRRYRVWASIAVTAILFAFMHLNPWQAPAALILGVVFGWWFSRTRSLWPCMYGHALNNGLAHLVINIPGTDTPGSDNAAEFPPLWFIVSGLALFAMGATWTSIMFRRLPPAQVARPLTPPATAPVPPEPDVPEDAWHDPIILQRLAEAQRRKGEPTSLAGDVSNEQ